LWISTLLINGTISLNKFWCCLLEKGWGKKKISHMQFLQYFFSYTILKQFLLYLATQNKIFFQNWPFLIISSQLNPWHTRELSYLYILLNITVIMKKERNIFLSRYIYFPDKEHFQWIFSTVNKNSCWCISALTHFPDQIAFCLNYFNLSLNHNNMKLLFYHKITYSKPIFNFRAANQGMRWLV